MEEDEEVRSLFSTVVARTVPTVGFSADDVVAGGRARVRRRRYAVLGGMASVAVAGLAAAVVSGGAGGSVRPAAPPDDRAFALAQERIVAADFQILLKDLDPAGKNLIEEDESKSSEVRRYGVCNRPMSSPTTLTVAYMTAATWTADGKPPTGTSPFVTVGIVLGSPIDSLGMPWASHDGWGPSTTTRLSDGSVVETVSTMSGSFMVDAERKLPDKRTLHIWATDEAKNSSARPTDPFPFTEDQLARVVSDMAIKFPFANGVLPKCLL